MADAEPRRLHPLSWLFITATSLRGLIVPAVLVLFASGGNPFARYELLSLLIVAPALVAALLKQGVYNYRFGDEELVIREGILFKKERHIPYDRVHNVALVRNPFHRMLGVASARVETAAGGEPEAVMRVLTLEAVDELRRFTLGKERGAADSAAAGAPAAATAATAHSGVLLHVPAVEIVRLGLISNRGFLVVAAVMGVASQTNWWDRDWDSLYEAVSAAAPQWMLRVLQPGSASLLAMAILGGVLVFILLLRLFSIGWYLVKYYDFELRWEDDDLRTEYGLLTRVSSLIPVRRVQLVTVSASLLHRWFGRAGVDLETAGAVETEGGGDLDNQLGAVGLGSNRQWLAPVIEPRRAVALVRDVMPEIDIDAVTWSPIAARATARILRRSLLLVALLSAVAIAVLELSPIPVSG